MVTTYIHKFFKFCLKNRRQTHHYYRQWLKHCTLCSKLAFLFLLCTSRFLPLRLWLVQLRVERSEVQMFSLLCTTSISNQMMMGSQSRSGSHCPLQECLCHQPSVQPLVCLLFDLVQRHKKGKQIISAAHTHRDTRLVKMFALIVIYKYWTHFSSNPVKDLSWMSCPSLSFPEFLHSIFKLHYWMLHL